MRTSTKKISIDKYAERIELLNLSKAQKRDLHTILVEPVDYVPDDHFRSSSYMAAIDAKIINVMPGSTLTAEEEQTLFLQFNYARYRMGLQRRKLINAELWDDQLVQQLLAYYHRQLQARIQIITSNMGLVLALSKRANYSGVEFPDLISEGSITLLRATEKFDCARGVKFSTYAWRAISRAFARLARKNHRYRSLFPVHWDPALEKDDIVKRNWEESCTDWVHEMRTILQDNLANLSGTEMSVVKMRFSFNQETPEPLTLQKVGEKLSLSKERIRQIQNNALVKLQEAIEKRMVAS